MLQYQIRHITARRASNLLLIEGSYILSRLLRRPIYKGLPYCASVEPVNYCQLHCPHCPTGNGSLHKVAHQLPLADYQRLIDQMAPTLLYLNLYFQGEPTLHPSLPQMVAYAHQRGIYTSLSTNGQHWDLPLATALAQAGLNHVIIDLDGADEASYQAYRRGGSLAQALDAIRNAVQAGLNVEVQCLLLATTEHQQQAIIDLARQAGAEHVTFKTAQLYSDELCPSQESLSRYTHRQGTLQRKGALHRYCHRLWTGIVINTYGQALPCCFDKNSEYAFGNLLLHPLQAVVHSEAANHFRKGVWQHREQIPICQNCSE